jgi:hypothetical protein
MNSKQKGKRGELELAAFLRTQGFEGARRGRQFSGLGAPDLVGVDGVHIECKRCERGSLYEWLAQAIDDCNGNMPVVMHRRSRGDWIAILRADDFLGLIKPKE